jgi:peptidoglycan/xylan/chitin deacetylase (PgdA/CDA1 family)
MVENKLSDRDLFMSDVMDKRIRHCSRSVIAQTLWLLGYYRHALRGIRHPFILKYHRMRPAGREVLSNQAGGEFSAGIGARQFEAHLRLITRWFKPIPMAEMGRAVAERKALPDKAVALTFDDGYRDNYEVAYPLLKRYGVPASFFVCPGLIDSHQGFWWDEIYALVEKTTARELDIEKLIQNLGLPSYHKDGALSLLTGHQKISAGEHLVAQGKQMSPQMLTIFLERLNEALGVPGDSNLRKQTLMNWDEIREMHHDGMEIGSHTMTHPMLTQVTESVMRTELSDARARLSEMLGAAPEGFVYPSGAFSATARNIVREAGHIYACTSQSGFIGGTADPHLLPRVNVSDRGFAASARDIVLTYGKYDGRN